MIDPTKRPVLFDSPASGADEADWPDSLFTKLLRHASDLSSADYRAGLEMLLGHTVI